MSYLGSGFPFLHGFMWLIQNQEGRKYNPERIIYPITRFLFVAFFFLFPVFLAEVSVLEISSFPVGKSSAPEKEYQEKEDQA